MAFACRRSDPRRVGRRGYRYDSSIRRSLLSNPDEVWRRSRKQGRSPEDAFYEVPLRLLRSGCSDCRCPSPAAVRSDTSRKTSDEARGCALGPSSGLRRIASQDMGAGRRSAADQRTTLARQDQALPETSSACPGCSRRSVRIPVHQCVTTLGFLTRASARFL